jgi:hypothetical protein
MKIKTVIFWILWVGNDLTLQTVREQNPDPPSPPPVPNRIDDLDPVSQKSGLIAVQKEQMEQLTEGVRPQLKTVHRQAQQEQTADLKQLSNQAGPVLSGALRPKLDALHNVVDGADNNFGNGINSAF